MSKKKRDLKKNRMRKQDDQANKSKASLSGPAKTGPCVIDGITIKGNVRLGPYSRMSGFNVDGNVEAMQHAELKDLSISGILKLDSSVILNNVDVKLKVFQYITDNIDILIKDQVTLDVVSSSLNPLDRLMAVKEFSDEARQKINEFILSHLAEAKKWWENHSEGDKLAAKGAILALLIKILFSLVGK